MEFSLTFASNEHMGNIGVKKEVDDGTSQQPPIVN